MELYIQMGHGMQAMCKELSAYWGSAHIIISPMKIQPNSIEKFAKEVQKQNGETLIDPQLYYPRKYHKNLQKHAYWPQGDYTFVESGGCDNVLRELHILNEIASTKVFILPSSIATQIDNRWNIAQQSMLNSAQRICTDKHLYHTIAITGDVLNDDTQVEQMINYVQSWAVQGIYLVCEHPERYYLVDKPLWLTNLLALECVSKRINEGGCRISIPR